MTTSSPKNHSQQYYSKKSNRQPPNYCQYNQSQSRQKSVSRVSRVSRSKMDYSNQMTAHSIHPSQISQKMDYIVGRDCEIGMFQPGQDVGVLLKNFQEIFQVLLNKCMGKYRDLTKQCIAKYEQIRRVLMHYPESNHTKQYFHQMHIKSTETKIKLLKMLKDEQKGLKTLQQENEDLKLQVKQLKKLSTSKGEAYLEQASIVKQLQAKIQDLTNKLASYQEKQKKLTMALEEKEKNQKDLRDELKDRVKKLGQLQADKQNMKKNLNQIQDQVRSIRSISPPESEIKKKNTRKVCIKIPSKSQITYDKINEDHGIGEEFYRFLLIQACTIQQQFEIE